MMQQTSRHWLGRRSSHRVTAFALSSLAAVAAAVPGCVVSNRQYHELDTAPHYVQREVTSPLDTDWMVVWVEDFSGDPTALIPLPGFILTRQGGRVTGETSCNRISAGYRIDEQAGRLRFSNIRNTRHLCQRANSEADDAIIRALLATDGYYLDGDRLELLSRGRVVARLRAK